MAVTTGKILKYTLLPEVIPRIFELLTSSFSHVAYFMAYIYFTVRLLPRDHAYLRPANIGRYGIRHVMAEAGSRLVYKRENADQIIIYFTLLAGFVLMFLQLAALVFTICTGGAYAETQADWFAKFLVTPVPTYDLAYRVLDHVFGLQGIFNSCVSTAQPCRIDLRTGQPLAGLTAEQFPTMFHVGLSGLFHFYNVGLLVIAVIIVAYFIVTIIAETAQTGEPFGRRFNHAWAPIRLLVALGAMTPILNGYNAAQVVTLYTAKFGSSIATNGWNTFLNATTNAATVAPGQNVRVSAVEGVETPMGHSSTLIALPNAPAINTLPEFMFVAVTCRLAELKLHNRQIAAYLVGSDGRNLPVARAKSGMPIDWGPAAAWAEGIGQGNDPAHATESVVVRFGEYNETLYPKEKGHVRPICGELSIPIRLGYSADGGTTEPGADYVQVIYWQLILGMWGSWNYDSDNTTPCRGSSFCEHADAVTRRFMQNSDADAQAQPIPTPEWVAGFLAFLNCSFRTTPACEEVAANATQEMKDDLGATPWAGTDESVISYAQRTQAEYVKWVDQAANLGWAGAAIWYNKIAQFNGSFVGAVYTVPIASKYPEAMEQVWQQRRASEKSITSKDRFNPYIGGKKQVAFAKSEDTPEANALFAAQSFWLDAYKQPSGSPVLDTIYAIFGLQGILNIRENIAAGIHPLAQIAAIGKGMIESAMTNLGFSFGAGVMGGLLNIVNQTEAGGTTQMFGSMVSKVAFMGLTMGFLMFYLIPYMPFLYFFFAFGTWVKNIFEAMVGMPLWALGHLRIDGNGLPGPTGLNGYYLMLEVLLRPILIIFGLIGGVLIFASEVQVLNVIWEMVTSNVVGFDYDTANKTVTTPAGSAVKVGTTEFIRGAADQLFYTVIYVIAVYMMGLSSFKMIDLIPANFLRWLNSAAGFNENADDPAQGLVTYAYIGTQSMLFRGQGLMGALFLRNS
jgi:conjugal transfer/type IV secretion protein DotA/TraY